MPNDNNHNSGGIAGSSILDKIITSKEIQEKQEFDPQEVVLVFLKKLSNKEAEVIKARYGLADYPKETLEAIGQRHEVTRERIRQIENLAISKIKADSQFRQILKPVEHVLNGLFGENGGVMEENYILEQLFSPAPASQSQIRSLLFILSKLLDQQYEKIGGDKKYKPAWKQQVASLSFLDQTIEEIVKLLNKEGQPLPIEELMSSFRQTDFFRQNSSQLDDKIVLSYLAVVKTIDRNPFEEYGLIGWGMIRPKRMNDKIKLLMEKEGKPMHFVEIAEKIGKLFKKRAYSPTVHNELILNKDYVLVGRGIYALQKWGYKKGVVADILVNILKESKQPLSREELVKKVSEQRIVKRNTIHLALTNKEKFTKLPDGRYTLKQESVLAPTSN